MNTIGDFQVLRSEHIFSDRIQLWLAEDSLGREVLVLTIQVVDEHQVILERTLRNEIQPLLHRDIAGVGKILFCDFDGMQKAHYIVYECKQHFNSLDRSKPTLKALVHLLKGLDALKKENRQAFYISPQTIYTNGNECLLIGHGLLDVFRYNGALNAAYLAPETKLWAQGERKRPNFQSDIYSVFKCFENAWVGNTRAALNGIVEKALAENNTNRHARYAELIELLSGISNVLSTRSSDQREAIKVTTGWKNISLANEFVTDMGIECFFMMDEKLSKKGQITGRFSTRQFSGRFFVDHGNYIFIGESTCKNSPDSNVREKGFLCEYSFAYHPWPAINCIEYFRNKREQNNALYALNKKHTELLKKWRTLPDMEREHMEESAFKAIFVGREESKSNSSNIRFRLTPEFRSWNRIRQLKESEIPLSIDGKIIGKVLDYSQRDHSLLVKDSVLSVEEIPLSGELIQDIGKETGQFKKQVEAIKRFEKKDIVNPDLCGILTTPDSYSGKAWSGSYQSDYEQFAEQVINADIKNDKTQRDAVYEALHTKPIYLIQGPPGTGKTTVIVELIQQILRSDRHARILVTSQSNLAVDNVLERLPDEISFMRLAAEEEKIGKPKIKEHSFQSMTRTWVEQTRKKSEMFLERNSPAQGKDKALLAFCNKYLNLAGTGDEFSLFQQQLRFENTYIKQLFEKADSIKAVRKIFGSRLGTEYLRLRQIQKDWFAFLANIESGSGEKKKAMLRNGSGEIDFRSALLKSVNVIGATCIHIASGLYNKVDFRFDYVIMDESSKASPAETLVPVNMGRNVVLIGDHKQLPPVVTREKAVHAKVKEVLEDNGLDVGKAFGESLFERLITSFSSNPNSQQNIKMLDVQYRMPRQIGNLISCAFYDGKLKNPDPQVVPGFDAAKAHGLNFRIPVSSIIETLNGKRTAVPTSMLFVSTSARENPHDNDNKSDRKNECNLHVVKEVLSRLNLLYGNNMGREKPFTVGIIAGYRGQVDHLRQRIDINKYTSFLVTKKNQKPDSLIHIDTVDKFQGAETDIIIYDIVKSSKEAGSIGFLDDYRRINVAFSRAKRLLIVVGDSEYILKRATLSPESAFREFKLQKIVQEFQKQNLIVNSLDEMIV